MTPWRRRRRWTIPLVVIELFLPRSRERARGKRDTDRLYTATEREREREGRTRDAHNALRGGGKRRKEEKKERRTQRNAAQRGAARRGRTYERINAVFTSRRIVRAVEFAKPTVRASPSKIRSIDWLIVAFASVPSLFFFRSSFFRRATCASVCLSLPLVRSSPFFALADALCLSLFLGRSVR